MQEPHKRFKVVVPENYHRFPPHFSLTSLLLYSPRALRRIANFCRGRHAYILPNVVGPEEQRLSMALNLPLLAVGGMPLGIQPLGFFRQDHRLIAQGRWLTEAALG